MPNLCVGHRAQSRRGPTGGPPSIDCEKVIIGANRRDPGTPAAIAITTAYDRSAADVNVHQARFATIVATATVTRARALAAAPRVPTDCVYWVTNKLASWLALAD